MTDVAVNQQLTLTEPAPPAPPAQPPVISPGILSVGPNPSTDQFAITIEVPAGATGRLFVYDVAGRVVSKLGPLSPTGPRTIFWNGSTSSGDLLSTGVYFLRLETNLGASEAKRIVIIR